MFFVWGSIYLVFVWVVAMDLISAWGIEIELISLQGSELTWFLCGGRKGLGFDVWIEIYFGFCVVASKLT